MINIGDTLALKSSPKPDFLLRFCLNVVFMLSNSLLAYSTPPILERTFKAPPSLLSLARNRGLSGTKNISTKKSTAGKSSAQNIQRHPCCTFQELRFSCWLTIAATGSAIHKFITWAAKIPTTMVNWLMETSLPRHSAGETSAIYRGDKVEASPIPIPPRTL